MDFESDEELKQRQVRLFPTVRISSVREAELRATAGLLAMIRAVSEFGRSVVRMAGGPAGKMSCFTEVPFHIVEADGSKTEQRPDGIIRAVRGKKDWRALVEVKVGDNPLEQGQFDDYHRLAKDRGFSALITVSNQAATPSGLPPLSVDKRRLRGVPAVHLSWDRLLSEARMLSQRKAVEDPDQQWMLDEWIKYVADPNSRIIEPPGLGPHWGEIVKAARGADLAPVSRHLPELVRMWEGYLRKAALLLRAKLGVEVHRKLRRKDRADPATRRKRMEAELLTDSRLTGTLTIPDAAGDVSVDVLLQSSTARFSIELSAPTEGRQKTRINWLLRQLKGTAMTDASIRVDWDKPRLQSGARIGEALANIDLLLRDLQGRPIGKEAAPRRFTIEWIRPLQKARGKSTVKILEGVSSDLERFYGRLVEGLVPFVPRAPKLPEDAGPPDAAGDTDDSQALSAPGRHD